MLFILYGAASEIGHKSTDYLKEKGIEVIDKYTYCEEKVYVQTRFGERNYLSKEEFEKKTDSLFRYEFANMIIGFDWSQITDAVYSDGETEKKHKLLTLATSNVQILRKIKEVYPNDVKIIYCHIDTVCLENMYTKLNDMTPEEYGVRMVTGKNIKDIYTKNADVFDYTVIYSGESSVFDYAALCKQYDAILKTIEDKGEAIINEKYDIFVSYCREQEIFARSLVMTLQELGFKVFNPNDAWFLRDSYLNEISRAILNSKIYIPIISNKAMESKYFLQELNIPISFSKNSGTVIYPIVFNCDDLEWNKYCSILGLANVQAYRVDNTNYEDSIHFISDRFNTMFSAEVNLVNLSSKVKEYTSAGLWDKAVEMQKQYIVILKKYMDIEHKEDSNMLISAQIKYLDLLLQSKAFDEASEILDEILSTLSPKKLLQFEDELIRLFIDFSNVTDSYKIVVDKIDTCKLDLSQFKEKFINTKNTSGESINFKISDTPAPLVDKIANYGKATIELFEALFENGLAPGYSETLISAYDRILSYCKSVNLGNEIPAMCIDKISELRSYDKSEETSECGESTLQSLKVYLGQALPNTGKYDVFISHKSEDDEIATKVYDYLQQTGRVAFCDHYTLRELHDSEYDKRIIESLDNSKHVVVVASDPEYLKDKWVYSEWHRFYNDKRLNLRNGNLILVLSDDLMGRIADLPSDLRDGIEIIKTSEFRNRIDDYLW